MEKQCITAANAPEAIGPYCHATIAGGMVYCSGSIGLIPETKKLVEGGVGPQARQTLVNMKNVVEGAGSDMSKVVKCTVLLADMETFAEVNAIYAEFFPSNPPARACFAVKGLPAGSLVEIDCIAIA